MKVRMVAILLSSTQSHNKAKYSDGFSSGFAFTGKPCVLAALNVRSLSFAAFQVKPEPLA